MVNLKLACSGIMVSVLWQWCVYQSILLIFPSSHWFQKTNEKAGIISIPPSSSKILVMFESSLSLHLLPSLRDNQFPNLVRFSFLQVLNVFYSISIHSLVQGPHQWFYSWNKHFIYSISLLSITCLHNPLNSEDNTSRDSH